MPTLTAVLNGKQLAQVCAEWLDILSVRVHGTRVDDEFADLEMSGGQYPEQGNSTYLTWISSVSLKPRDLLEVTFSDAGNTSHAGKTIDELFPNEPASPEKVDFAPTSEMFEELRAKQHIRCGHGFTLTTSEGVNYTGRTNDSEHGFGFSVVWNSHRPERANLSLHSYTIDSMEHKQPMRDHVREYIQAPYSVVFRVDA